MIRSTSRKRDSSMVILSSILYLLLSAFAPVNSHSYTDTDINDNVLGVYDTFAEEAPIIFPGDNVQCVELEYMCEDHNEKFEACDFEIFKTTFIEGSLTSVSSDSHRMLKKKKQRYRRWYKYRSNSMDTGGESNSISDSILGNEINVDVGISFIDDRTNNRMGKKKGKKNSKNKEKVETIIFTGEDHDYYLEDSMHDTMHIQEHGVQTIKFKKKGGKKYKKKAKKKKKMKKRGNVFEKNNHGNNGIIVPIDIQNLILPKDHYLCKEKECAETRTTLTSFYSIVFVGENPNELELDSVKEAYNSLRMFPCSPKIKLIKKLDRRSRRSLQSTVTILVEIRAEVLSNSEFVNIFDAIALADFKREVERRTGLELMNIAFVPPNTPTPTSMKSNAPTLSTTQMPSLVPSTTQTPSREPSLSLVPSTTQTPSREASSEPSFKPSFDSSSDSTPDTTLVTTNEATTVET